MAAEIARGSRKHALKDRSCSPAHGKAGSERPAGFGAAPQIMHPAAVRSLSSTAVLVFLSIYGSKRSKQPLPSARNSTLTPEERYVPLRREPKLFESLLRDEWLTPEARAVAWRCGLSPLDSAAPDSLVDLRTGRRGRVGGIPPRRRRA